MRLARWLLCFPFAAVIGVSVFLLIGKLEVSAVYSAHHVARSVAKSLPYFMLSLLPNALFVATAAIIAPGRKKTVVLVAALSAGMWSFLAAFIFPSSLPWFNVLNLIGSLSGVAVGAFVVLLFPLFQRESNG